MLPQDPKDVEIAKKIAPAIHTFTKAIDDAGLLTTILIFDKDGPFLIRAGNAPHVGLQFVRLHYYLSLAIAQLDASGYKCDLSDFTGEGAPNTPTGPEIAAKLALACIAVPSELIPDRIRALAQNYLQSVGEN